MARPKSWSVKGIDGDTRELARNAAQAAGQPIGAWIDQAILKAKRGELPGLAELDLHRPSETVPTPAAEEAPATASIPDDVPTPAPESVELPAASEAEMIPEPGIEDLEATAPAVPAADPNRPVVADPSDRLSIGGGPSEDQTDNMGVPPPRPLAPPPPRPSLVRYGIAAAMLLAILGGGIWVFIEFSSTERTPLPQTIADAQRSSPQRAETPAPSAPTTTPPASRTKPGLPDEVRTGMELAEAGDAKAQHDLGMLHLTGRYVEKDLAAAAKWFERAAVQGLVNAQFNLGVLYERGQGVAKNDQLAFFWYQSAAEKGFERAQHNLAMAYADGRGVPQNYAKAVEWLTKAADAGLGASQFSLATIYERGLVEGKADLNKAIAWYERAAAQGDTKAMERLAVLSPSRPDPAAATEPKPGPTAPAVVSRNLSKNDILEIQVLLDALNFNPGPADGDIGPRTVSAIKLYQGFAGMTVDGKPSRDLLEDLQAVAKTMSKGG